MSYGHYYTDGNEGDLENSWFNIIKNPMYKINANNESTYSPLALNTAWPSLLRLCLVILIAVLGSIFNGYFVASFFLEPTFKKRGNVFLACTGLSDLLITAGVIPTAAVILLSNGQWDSIVVCRGVQILAQTSTYSYNMLYVFAAANIYFKIHKAKNYKRFLALPIATISCTIFILSFILAFFGVFLKLDYDYCKREYFGNTEFRLLSLGIFHIFPLSIICSYFCLSLRTLRNRRNKVSKRRRSQQLIKDYAFTKLNVFYYAIFVMAWIPYHITIYRDPDSSDRIYYVNVWIGIIRSSLTSIFYGVFDRYFRRCYSNLFYYCCCKSKIGKPFAQRHRRCMDYRLTSHKFELNLRHEIETSNIYENVLPPRDTHSLSL